MGRTNQKPIKPSRTKQMQERAVFFQRLVDGAGDRKFAAKLQGLIDEYERGAKQAVSETETPGARSFDGVPAASLEQPTG